ncbi:M24 family metallopeptidase [Poriferisphaera sp. WC338]|uniref:M24 family metallopeptidase n=1 Tax=Poriferisphaera sp. WC338 TaxID=3425129 RepID=UPI003D818F81
MINLKRKSIVQSYLRDAGVSGWLAWRPDELVMLLGYQPHWGTSLCFFPYKGDPVLFVPTLEPKETLPNDVETVQYDWGLMSCSDPLAMLEDLIHTYIRNKNLDMLPISYVRSSSHSAPGTSPAEHPPFDPQVQNLFEGLGQSVQHLDDKLLALYTIKTPEEIERIRLANHVADHGLAVFFDNLREGIREASLAAEIERAIHSRTGAQGISYARAWAHVQSGPNSANAGRYNRSSGRTLTNGDMVTVELATCVNGYWSDLTRTGYVGEPDPAAKQLWSIVAEAQAAARKQVKAGIRMSEIDQTARTIIEDAGYGKLFTHATGHHTGFRYHDPGPTLAPGINDILKEGMIVTVEPGVYDPAAAMGCRIEDNLCVTAGGSDCLSTAARDLHGKQV